MMATVTARMARTATEPTATIRTEPTAEPAKGRFPHLARLVGDDRLGDFLAERLGKDSFRRRLPAGAALFGWAAAGRLGLAPPINHRFGVGVGAIRGAE